MITIYLCSDRTLTVITTLAQSHSKRLHSTLNLQYHSLKQANKTTLTGLKHTVMSGTYKCRVPTVMKNLNISDDCDTVDLKILKSDEKVYNEN